MATIQIPPDFKEFLKLLNEHEVRYLLIGGYAVSTNLTHWLTVKNRVFSLKAGVVG